MLLESGNVHFRMSHLLCAMFLCLLCMPLGQIYDYFYDDVCTLNVCVLQQPWGTTFWQTQCYRLALVPLLTTLCWLKASPHPHLVSSTLLVSSSWTLHSVCAVLSVCVRVEYVLSLLSFCLLLCQQFGMVYTSSVCVHVRVSLYFLFFFIQTM